MLPGASFFLGMPYGPARKAIDSGAIVALASDYNPGSSPSGNMRMVMSLGCIKMKMTPAEAINATTINGAYAMNESRDYGSIAPARLPASISQSRCHRSTSSLCLRHSAHKPRVAQRPRGRSLTKRTAQILNPYNLLNFQTVSDSGTADCARTRCRCLLLCLMQ